MLLQHSLWAGTSAAAITAGLGGDPGPVLPWVTVAEWVPTGNSTGWAGFTVRQIINSSVLTAEGSMVRLTFKAHTTGLAITDCYIGFAAETGDSYDFFDVPTQVTFNEGDPGFDIGASVEIKSDPIEFEYEGGRNLIVAWHVPDDAGTKGTLVSRGSQTGWSRVYKDTGVTSDAATVDASTYLTSGVTDCISMTEIEFVLSGAAGGTNIRIPPWRLSADLTGFPVLVDLADLDDSFWEGTTETGGNIRVTNAADSPLPCDVVFFDKGARQGRLFFKASLSTAANNDFKVVTEPGGVTPDPASTYGRNAVWSVFEAMFAFESLVDRTGKGHDAVLSGSSSTYDYSVTAVGPAVNVHQGVAYDGTYFYAIDTNAIKKYNSSWVLQDTNSSPLADTGTPDVNHLGDGCIHGGELFIVYERYPNSPYDNQHVGVFDPATLDFIRTYDISAQGHEVSSICWDATNGYFVITDFTSPGYTKLHKYDEDFAYLGFITIPSTPKMQGIEYYDGFFWIATDGKTLYKLTLDGATRTIAWSGSISGYMEGIAAKGDGSFFILFDGSPSAIYTFGLSATAGEPGWLNLAGGGQAKTNVVPAFTSWVIGASYIPRASTQGAIVSYSKDETANTTRSTMVHRNGTSLGIWNTTDSWLDPAGTDMNLLREYRGHMLHDGTTLRKIYYNGILRGTDNTVAQKPGAATTPILFIGAEDASLSERASGSINYVYLHDGVLSDAWLYAEGLNWLTPEMFYDVLDQADANAGEKVDFANPAATTDATGWTNRFGASPGRTTSRFRSSPAAFHAGNGAVVWWDAEVTVPSGQHTYIDAGAVLVEIPHWRQGLGSDADEAGPVIEFRDGGGVLLARRWWPRNDIPGDIGFWDGRKTVCPVPVGTRAIRWGVNAVRATGTELSQYFDDIGPAEFKSLPGYLAKLIYWNQGNTVSGFVNVAGTLGVYNNTQVWNVSTNNVLYWSADAAGEAYYPIDVSADAGAIDAGGCRIDAYTFQSAYSSAGGRGRAYVEFRDGTDSLVGTRHWFSDEFRAPVQGIGLFLDVEVPATTRTIRWGMVGTREDGAALDAYQQNINVFLKTPRS